MNLFTLLDMAAGAMGDRVAVGSRHGGGITYAELLDRSAAAGRTLAKAPGERLVYAGLNSELLPICLFGAAHAGMPFVPVNYRLEDDQLRHLVARTAPAVAVTGEDVAGRLGPIEDVEFLAGALLRALVRDGVDGPADAALDPDGIAVLLYTSGTTGEPKAAVLRHRHISSYILGAVDFAGAAEDEAALISVPPYHIAGVAAAVSSLFAGRRIVYLDAFDVDGWIDAVRRERVTHTMVVPTMLKRLVERIVERDVDLPSLRALSYGGGPMPVDVIERALERLAHVGFVNAYGLTETSSTIALLGPEDHRTAAASDEPALRRRLGSVGRPLPGVEVTIRDAAGAEVPAGAVGEIWVRGPQVAGEYLGRSSDLVDGWYRTRDAGVLDDGFLHVRGRLDDVIVRGGENLSPGEIEEVLVSHPAVTAAAVVGIPDEEWGERVVAAATLTEGCTVGEEELRAHVRARLRSTRTPERIDVCAELPFNETGKLLRRVLRQDLAQRFG